jgi:phenylpropionate dioxygenase-like ring-hydroxylating dioxygenase large terminal subunit
MIREQWYVVLESREVGSKPMGFVRMGERLVFWRDDAGKVACHLDKCAHRGASLASGAVLHGEVSSDREGGRIQCPFHGIEYDASGRGRVIPANGRSAPVPDGFRLHCYPTYEARGFIWIWWGEDAPDSQPGFFEDLPETLSWSTRQDPWANHYSRAIENQLDMAHLPFVHYNTIGKGGKTVVDGPGIRFADKGLFVYSRNRLDDGSLAKTPAEIALPDLASDTGQKLEFRFPNLWQNYIDEKLRIVVAFVPVDQESSILYLRFCQGFMRVAGLRALVHAVGDRMNLVIAHQDRRVVETQIPKSAGEGRGELLFPGDAAIMEYRKMRLEAAKALGEARSAARGAARDDGPAAR